VLGGGAVAGSIAYRRRAARRIERVELYGEDGSVATLAAGSPEAERLLTLVRDLLVLSR
jgi:hypothetical protein